MAKTHSYGFRELTNDIHLWLGLASGIILFLVCLSGTILTFEHEIKDATREEMTVTPMGEKLAVSQLVTSLEEGGEGTVTGITIPAASDAPYRFSVKKDPSERRGTTVLVDPYTATAREEGASSADDFLFVMFRLHRWLLLDSAIGRPIVGVATIIFMVLAVSGIVLWFPRKVRWKSVKQGFKIKTAAGWKRINHDLHNTLGFYASIFIVIMGLTGLCWSFEGYREGLSAVIGAKVFDRSGPEFEAGAGAQETTISLDEAIASAHATLPGAGDLSVNLPAEQNAFYTFRKYDASAWSPVTYDQLYLSEQGQVLATVRFADKGLGERIAGLIKPLHTGEIFGTFSKILYFLACLIATTLPITGTLIWWNKLQKKRRRVSA
ncbi:putative iron-regulated membrane protein [Neolewinella xylanilytica]|uniref:Putative iron-regulated membrane protein n=1 Tax=Neolewinella xylanilytica TaxID=1514080 RepID=A0A2S6I9C7_9BACT|nr:PepSY-associated TM helix domain-containing protein [Neolewinella xylanilytica]PPK88082.1 putative iron-regulated membrane protein [Neolewinella xylanilytica]